MHYSVCVPAVLEGKEILEALSSVADAGFRRYEIWSWWNQDMDACQKAQQEKQLSIAALCTYFISLTDPACREEYLNGLQKTIQICHKLGCKTIISQVGQELENVSKEMQHASIVAGLRECIPLLKEHNLTLVIEPLNTRIDHPGYYLYNSEEAFEIVDEVNDEHIKVLYDLYHQYVMDDLSVKKIVKNIDKIGHFHMAGYPGRHEPMINSEINYPEILNAIRNSGYQKSIGLEYFPVQNPEEGLKTLFRQLEAI